MSDRNGMTAGMKNGAGLPPRINGVDPRQQLVHQFMTFSGISGLQAQLLGLTVEGCLCGRCPGWRIRMTNIAHQTVGGLEFCPEPTQQRPPEEGAGTM